jgi:hypothetical protein
VTRPLWASLLSGRRPGAAALAELAVAANGPSALGGGASFHLAWRWLVVALLVVSTFLNCLDRQILSLLKTTLTREFALTDTLRESSRFNNQTICRPRAPAR